MQRHWSFSDFQAPSMVTTATNSPSVSQYGLMPNNFFSPTTAMLSVPALFQGHILFPQQLLSMPISASSFLPTTAHHLVQHQHPHHHHYNAMTMFGNTFEGKNASQGLPAGPPKLTSETYTRQPHYRDELPTSLTPSSAINLGHFEQSPTAALTALLKGRDLPPVLKPNFSSPALCRQDDCYPPMVPQIAPRTAWKPTASSVFQAVGNQTTKRKLQLKPPTVTASVITHTPIVPPLVIRKKSPTELMCSMKPTTTPTATTKKVRYSPPQLKKNVSPKPLMTLSQSCSELKDVFRKEKEAALARQTDFSIVDLDDENSVTLPEISVVIPECPAIASTSATIVEQPVETVRKRGRKRKSKEDPPVMAVDKELAPTLQACTVATSSCDSVETTPAPSRNNMPGLEVQPNNADFDSYEPPPKLLAFDAPIEIEVEDLDNCFLPPGPNSNEENNNTLLEKKAVGNKKRSPKQRPVKIFSNWKPIGEGIRNYVYYNNDTKPVKRVCYQSVQHKKAKEIIRVRDCVVVRATDGLGHIGKVTRLFLDDDTSSLMASIVWYYRVDQLETETGGVQPPLGQRELLASRHIDVVSVDTVEDVAFVLTYHEYCRYVAENVLDITRPVWPESTELWSRGDENYPRRDRMPREDTPGELVYFCRRVYDFKQKRILPFKAPHVRSMLHAPRRGSNKPLPMLLNPTKSSNMTPPCSA